MSFELFLSVTVSGVLTGLVYGLGALGLSVIFGVLRIVNFAHGELMAAGMYAAVLAGGLIGLDPLLAAPGVALLWFAAGWGLQRGLIAGFVTAPEHRQFILMVGIATMIVNALLMGFGPDARGVMVDYAFDAYEIGPLLIDAVRVWAGGVAIAVALGLFAFFRVSSLGTAIRACADNPLGARVIGLDLDRLYAFTFALGTAVVGTAGCLMTLIGDVRPGLAPEYTLMGFIIVIVGGLGSAAGALLGGVLIGVSEALAGVLLTPSMKSMFSYGLLILVLLFRPNGLMGRPA